MRPQLPDPFTEDDVLRIAAFAGRSPSLEAQVIAYVYHRFAGGLARHVGEKDNNWYGYAKWTSKAVAESLDLTSNSPFLMNLGSRLHVPVWLNRPFRRVLLMLLGGSYQLGLSLANRSIFLEMGSFLAEFWKAPRSPDCQLVEARRLVFLTDLLDDEAKEKYLRLAASLLTEAKSTPDAELRGELILGANVALSAYEQQRAQKLLALVLYRPVRWLLRVSWRAMLHSMTGRPLRRLRLYTEPHDKQSWLVRVLEDWWARMYTRHVLALRIPGREIRVGKPLQPPQGASAPVPLRNEQVRKLVDEFLGANPGRECAGVANWLSYEERMRFIVCYFRAYQHELALFDPPFDQWTEAELAGALDDGQVPEPVREQWQRNSEPGAAQRVTERYQPKWLPADPDIEELAKIDLRDLVVKTQLKL